MERYPATYTDAHGTEQTFVTNDGKVVELVVRDVTFRGSDFDMLEADADTAPEKLQSFTRDRGDLCAFELALEIPVPVVTPRGTFAGTLHVELSLGQPRENRGLDRQDVTLSLTCESVRVRSFGMSGWFEDELLDLQKQLAEGCFIKACINCQYSDYSPYGHGLFGGMMCFRNIKSEYVRVRTKKEFFTVHDRFDRRVQETYLCTEFERRTPGTGYRG